MYNSTQAKLERCKQARRRRLVVNCMCIALIGTATWFISASVAETNKANEVAQQLQAVNEQKEVLQREIERLELVVKNGVFFQGNDEWLSEELGITDFLDPYQSIDAGTHIIASLLLKYQDPHKALMAYNYGEAGARSHWNRGTYTSSYSREVAGKQEQILNKGI